MPLYLFSLLLHAYLALRLLPALAAWPLAQGLLGQSLLASTVMMPLGLTARRFKSPLLADRMAWTGMLFMGLFSSLFVLSLLRDIALLLAWGVLALAPGMFSLDAVSADSAVAVALLGLLMTLIGFFNARRTAAVVRVDVPIAGRRPSCTAFRLRRSAMCMSGPPSSEATCNPSWMW
jgi:hypothetical protein